MKSFTGLVRLVLSCLLAITIAVLAIVFDSDRWTEMSTARRQIVVGIDNGKCCTLPGKNTCESPCVVNPYCPTTAKMSESCNGDAQCNSQSGYYCTSNQDTTFSVDDCQMTGSTIVTGCAHGQARCEWKKIGSHNVTVKLCIPGESLCPVQPTPRCQ